MDSNTRCLSPPPRMPSPQLLPTPLPSPPLHHQQSRPRMNNASSSSSSNSNSKPPSPLGRPAISGSPSLPQRNLHAPRAQVPPPLDLSLWLDGDDFGARRARSTSPLSPTSPNDPGRPSRQDNNNNNNNRRSSSRPTPISTASPRSRTRPRSPPPSPGRPGTPPPVPPIPTHFLGASPGNLVLQPRSTNHLAPTCTGRIADLPSIQSHLLRKSKSSDAMTYFRFLTAHDSQ